jgi:phosphoribosylformimino-5-aminoimidazole carboxamide ribotide isomerase
VRIYGVIDLKAGQVVHAVAGRRAAYQPVRSRICRSATPAHVAQALVERLGLRSVYVADLDAISGQNPDYEALTEIAAAGGEVLVDAGCADVQRARQLAEFHAASGPLAGIVVALESLRSVRSLWSLARELDPERAVFSLDLQAGRLCSGVPDLQEKSTADVADLAWQAGFRRILILDLAGVGVAAGPVTLDTCRLLGRQHAWQEMISGGGVRHVADLRSLQQAGCHGVLVASALHAGTLGRAEFDRFHAI